MREDWNPSNLVSFITSSGWVNRYYTVIRAQSLGIFTCHPIVTRMWPKVVFNVKLHSANPKITRCQKPLSKVFHWPSCNVIRDVLLHSWNACGQAPLVTLKGSENRYYTCITATQNRYKFFVKVGQNCLMMLAKK